MKILTHASLVVLCALALTACGDDSTTAPTITPRPSPYTSTFTSRLTVNGSAARSFEAKAGAVSVRLTNAGGASNVVGVGLGLPNGGVSQCTLTTSVTTAPGPAPQLTANVDAGTYCVAVFDPGTLQSAIDFEVVIVYP